MKKCPAIVALSFDDESLKGIERIKELHDLSSYARLALTVGHLYTIFGGSLMRAPSSSGLSGFIKESPTQLIGQVASSELVQTSYAVTQANWEYFFQSFDNLGNIKRSEIYKVATQQALSHYRSPKEYQFWKSIAQGCTP